MDNVVVYSDKSDVCPRQLTINLAKFKFAKATGVYLMHVVQERKKFEFVQRELNLEYQILTQ